ncbi:MAG: hypothetical protein ACYC9L_02980 [Sulfuricaulis sp.]
MRRALDDVDGVDSVERAERDSPPSRTDLRHLRILADMLVEQHLPGAADEVRRALQEIEQARPVLEKLESIQELMAAALSAIDRSQARLAEKLSAWSAIDATKLSKEQRMERRDWEAELRRDVAYGHQRLLAAVRAFVEKPVPNPNPAAHEMEQRQMERASRPALPREWLQG